MSKKTLDTIKESFSLTMLPDNWDDEGAVPVNKDSWFNMFIYISNQLNYIKYLYKNDIECPEINVCPDGSIDLSWYNEKTRLLINVDDKRVSYYGDNFNPINYIKYETEDIYVIDKELCFFINNNLKQEP